MAICFSFFFWLGSEKPAKCIYKNKNFFEWLAKLLGT